MHFKNKSHRDLDAAPLGKRLIGYPVDEFDVTAFKAARTEQMLGATQWRHVRSSTITLTP